VRSAQLEPGFPKRRVSYRVWEPGVSATTLVGSGLTDRAVGGGGGGHPAEPNDEGSFPTGRWGA
jgi:hypothetical protein